MNLVDSELSGNERLTSSIFHNEHSLSPENSSGFFLRKSRSA